MRSTVHVAHNRRLGVWVEDGKVYRRSSEKDFSPKVYIPKDQKDLPKVKRLVERLHSHYSMGSWTSETEYEVDAIFEELKTLLKQD